LSKWRKQGCDLDDHASVQKWLERSEALGKKRGRKTGQKNQQPAFRVLPKTEPAAEAVAEPPISRLDRSEPLGNGELPPAGKKGAAAALERLESQEEEAHRRLSVALERGNAFQIQAAQEFWLKCSETLRRLDLAVETARREAETQVPLRVAQAAVLASAEWTRIAFMQFLSSEGVPMMGIRNLGDWKAYAIERFIGILHLSIKSAEKTNSAIPEWAVAQIKAAWNVE
jgi:hypothetical protein